MLFSTVACLVLTFFLLYLYFSMIVKPARIRKILKQQGIDGPPPKILLGNILDVKKNLETQPRRPHSTTRIRRSSTMPLLFYPLRRNGGSNMVCVGMPSYQQKVLGPLLGKGILPSNGSVWARQRKIIAPELFMDKVKGMMSIITESGLALVDSWKHKVESEEGGVVEIGVDHCMKRFSGDIISRACFGSSYSKGQEIFLKFDALQEIMSKRTFSALGIPGLRHLPTKRNRQIRALEKEISALILKIVKERRQAGREKDLLQTLLEGAKSSYSTSAAIDQFIVDNCRNIYLAGFETSAVSASWCLMLLASNPEWQHAGRG
ncbi:UNVERIFIED_CONTAM: cytochrome [Sesamum latifolium]|uniref:Cytochrome n=1 Tax=Sesamum latifolium TaxID=2727402 RepID=A0AAW2SNS7_9LAMI